MKVHNMTCVLREMNLVHSITSVLKEMNWEMNSEMNSVHNMTCFMKEMNSVHNMTCFMKEMNSVHSMTCFMKEMNWEMNSVHNMTCFMKEMNSVHNMTCFMKEMNSVHSMTCFMKEMNWLVILRGAAKHPLVKELGQVFAYMKCKTKKAVVACMKNDDLKKIVLPCRKEFFFISNGMRMRNLFVGESIRKVYHYCDMDLLGKAVFISLSYKFWNLMLVGQRLLFLEIYYRDCVTEALLPVKADVPQGLTRLCPGSRRAFFCRMRCKSAPVMKEEADSSTGCQKKKSKSQISDKKYSVIHFTGYLKSWAETKDPLDEDSDSDSCNLSCLVAVGRVHQPLVSTSVREGSNFNNITHAQPIQFISKHTNDGKFVFIDQKATLLLGWLPQELLGSSMYEYFHQDDIPALAETHRETLKSSNSIDTLVFRFRTKEGSFVRLQSTWRTFKNPWTKDIEYIISKNSMVTSETGVVESTMANDSVSQSYGNFNDFISSPDPRYFACKSALSGDGECSNGSSRLITGNGVHAGKIGRQIADEVLDNYRRSDSPSDNPLSPFEGILASGATDRSFAALLRTDLTTHRAAAKGDRYNLAPNEKRANFYHNACYSKPVKNNVLLSNNSTSNDEAGGDGAPDGASDSDEAAMAVIMSLLEADAGLGGPVDFSHLPW
ncbi:unnamed protein product, partial [Meganyctiphanes norvegica]